MKLIVDEILFWLGVVAGTLNGATAFVCLMALSWYAVLFAGFTAFWFVFARSAYNDIRAEVDR